MLITSKQTIYNNMKEIIAEFPAGQWAASPSKAQWQAAADSWRRTSFPRRFPTVLTTCQYHTGITQPSQQFHKLQQPRTLMSWASMGRGSNIAKTSS